MNKKYIVRLSDEERQVCQDVVKGCMTGFGWAVWDRRGIAEDLEF
jgi:hypothetical protein